MVLECILRSVPERADEYARPVPGSSFFSNILIDLMLRLPRFEFTRAMTGG